MAPCQETYLSGGGGGGNNFEELWRVIENMRLSAATALMDILQLRRAMARNRDYAAFSRYDSYEYSTTSKSYSP